MIPGEVNVMDRTFTASGLTPHTNYTFRVAGVNIINTGPYSTIIFIRSSEDGMLIIACLWQKLEKITLLAVPGVVSDLTGQTTLTSIVLTWSAPQEPNGVIISYGVTYRVTDGNLVTTNTTD